MIINAKPYPKIKDIFFKSFFYNTENISFYPSGRIALLSGLINLGVRKGDSIIIPAYMCNSSIKPLQAFGFNIIFIDVDKNLDLLVTEVMKVLKINKSIKALLVVHYFGFTRNIDELVKICQSFKVKVIEDASHSFMSQLNRNKKSIKGNLEIFSMRKSLPIIDGGALRINKGAKDITPVCNKNCISKIADVGYLLTRFLEKFLTKLGINIYGKFINSLKTKIQSNKNYKIYNLDVKACKASWLLKKYLGNKIYPKDAQKKILTNFNQLNQELLKMGFKLIFKVFNDNIVPQACVFYDNKGGLVEYLRSNGIGAWRWPDEEIPEEVIQNYSQYPNAIFFDKKLVIVPIHQNIAHSECNYIIRVLKKWKISN